jgi:hypothetical protein
MSTRFNQAEFLITTCTIGDLETWETSSNYILKNLAADKYLVIVPDEHVETFESVTDFRFEVTPESTYIGNLADRLIPLVREGGNQNSEGWYIQQFVKMIAASKTQNSRYSVIWDADTIPLKPINFVSKTGRIILFASSERHEEYFSLINRLFSFPKIANHSFISQCIAVRGFWLTALIKDIEKIENQNWVETVLTRINFSKHSAFSEFELIGNYVYNNFQDDFEVIKPRWRRDGNSLIGTPLNLTRWWSKLVLFGATYVSFETWDQPPKTLVGRLSYRTKNIINNLAGK